MDARRLSEMRAAEDTPSSSSGGCWAESPRGASGCSRAGGGFERRRERRQRLQGLHGYVARTVVTVATSAAMQLEALPDGAAGTPLATGSFVSDLVAGLEGFLRSALTGAGTHVREAIQDLTVAIGEPPRRPFEEIDTGNGLFWAMDMAIVLLVLAMCLFASGFATMPRECDGGKESASGSFWSEDTQDEVARPVSRSTRMFMAVILPALSGSVLNVKHSLVSALLCGL